MALTCGWKMVYFICKWGEVGKSGNKEPFMFYGEYSHTLDNKNRVIVPVKFREAMKEVYIERFFLTRGLERCIFAFSENEWNILEQKMRKLPLAQGPSRAFSRMFFSGAYEVVCDKQGRIVVPSPLLNYASIKKDVVLIGVLNRIEIWDQKAWNECVKVSTDSYEEIAEKLVDLGL